MKLFQSLGKVNSHPVLAAFIGRGEKTNKVEVKRG